MLREIFAGILILHGLIHILGFLQETLKIEIEGFTGETIITLSETMRVLGGILWFVTMLLFFLATFGFLQDHEWWVYLTIISVIISQVLVIIWWPDAKAGTIANILVVIGLFLDL